MKCIVPRKALSAALAVASHVDHGIPGAAQGLVLLRGDQAGLRVYAADTMSQVDLLVDGGQVEKPGAAGVNLKRLQAALNAMDEEAVSLSTTKASLVIAGRGRRRYTMPQIAEDAFLRPSDCEESDPELKVSCAELQAALRRVAPAMALLGADKSYLAGIQTEVEGQDLVCVATDGYRMHVCRTALAEPPKQWDCLIPRAAVEALLALPDSPESGEVILRAAASATWIITPTARIGSVRPGESYVPWRRLLPSPLPKPILSVEVSALSRALRVVTAGATGTERPPVTLTHDLPTKMLTLRCIDPSTGALAEDEVETEQHAERSFNIDYNAAYLREALAYGGTKLDVAAFDEGPSSLLFSGTYAYLAYVAPLRPD